MSDLLHGADEIAAFLGLQPSEVERLAASGELPTFTIGTKLLGASRHALFLWRGGRQTATATPAAVPPAKPAGAAAEPPAPAAPAAPAAKPAAPAGAAASVAGAGAQRTA